MCIVCEHELWDEHRALEREFFKACKRCKKFPGASTKEPAITVTLWEAMRGREERTPFPLWGRWRNM